MDITKLVQYRINTKIKSTYCDALWEYHTTKNQRVITVLTNDIVYEIISTQHYELIRYHAIVIAVRSKSTTTLYDYSKNLYNKIYSHNPQAECMVILLHYWRERNISQVYTWR